MPTTSNDLNISQAGYVAFDGTATFSGRTFQAGSNISLINADGVSGNTTITASNNHVARYIVSAGGAADGANYTTITSAYAAAVAAGAPQTVFIQPGTYTENITLTPGINIAAFTCDALTPNVTITGKLTLTAAGTVSISGINLKTNNAAAIEVSGSNASILNIYNCNLDCLNATGITFSSSNASSRLAMNYCGGNIDTTGITLFAHSSAGATTISFCSFGNIGGSSTASTVSAGSLNIIKSNLLSPITTSSTGAIQMDSCTINTANQNVTSLTLGGSGGQIIRNSRFLSGSASAISISSATSSILNCEVQSSNTNAITGAGTITYSGITFSGTSTTINTTTQTSCGTLQGSKNTAPAAGFLGERISSVVASVAAGSTTAVTTITSIDLTPGVWDVTAFANGTAGAANLTLIEIGISTVTNTLQGTVGNQYYISNTNSAIAFMTGSVPNFRVVVSTTTTYYLVVRLDYASGSPVVSGRLSAVRVG